MNNKENILRVRNLKISFRTISGKVQAVRNISFDLEKGKTLAIVGESGSGKSVTTRAVMGILAKNGIVESGEILYDGKDILKLSEWELHKIRGEKISMIFQDPLSSLNPIIKIGRQLTEAPILKNRSSRKENKYLFNLSLKAIESSLPQEEKKTVGLFKKTMFKKAKIELPYTYSKDFLNNCQKDIAEILFAIEKQQDVDLDLNIIEVASLARKALNPYLFDKEESEKIKKLALDIDKKIYPLHILNKVKKKKEGIYLPFAAPLKELSSLLEPAQKKETPDFLAIALEQEKISKEEFLNTFLITLAKSIEDNSARSEEAKEVALKALQKELPSFENPSSKKELLSSWKKLYPLVEKTINPLALKKDTYSYIFRSALKDEIQKYFNTLKNNEKESRRYEKEQAKWNALKAKGKEPSFKIVPANIISKDDLKASLCARLTSLINIYSEQSQATDNKNDVFEELNKLSLLSFKKHTHFMAKINAIRLMNEVGIPEPRKRFKQYPFEFSGGMRQRIVIAIALTNDPDILICDEPTTALDVTIQAQILELINRIKKERNLSVIFITHNLGVVANMADKIAVMYAGQIVEYGTSNDIFYDPKHPYTWALLSSMPDLETKEKLDAIPGTPPNMIFPPIGDAYAARNKYALKLDFKKEPPMYMVNPTHFAKTWLLDDRAPDCLPPEIVLARIVRMKDKYGEDIDKEMAEEINEPIEEAFASNSIKAGKKHSNILNAKEALKISKGEKQL